MGVDSSTCGSRQRVAGGLDHQAMDSFWRQRWTVMRWMLSRGCRMSCLLVSCNVLRPLTQHGDNSTTHQCRSSWLHTRAGSTCSTVLFGDIWSTVRTTGSVAPQRSRKPYCLLVSRPTAFLVDSSAYDGPPQFRPVQFTFSTIESQQGNCAAPIPASGKAARGPEGTRMCANALTRGRR